MFKRIKAWFRYWFCAPDCGPLVAHFYCSGKFHHYVSKVEYDYWMVTVLPFRCDLYPIRRQTTGNEES